MSKITLETIASLRNETSGVTAINNNFEAISDAIDNSLSLDGMAPNTIDSNIDMNGNRLINLPYPASNTDPVRLGDLNDIFTTGIVGPQGEQGETGPSIDIFTQASAPATDGPENSLWIDNDSTNYSLYKLISGVWTNTGVELRGAAGPTGSTGATGATGPEGPTSPPPSFGFQYSSSTTMADPGSGEFRFNSLTLSSVTQCALSDLDEDASDISAYILSWDDSTNAAIRGTLELKDQLDPTNFAIYNITGATTDNVGWSLLNITYVTHAGTLTNSNSTHIFFVRAGDAASADVVTDTTPQLGGDLDANGHLIVGGVNAASLATTIPPSGFDVPINLGMTASVASNILTVAIKGANGSDPSATNPVLIPFRSATAATGTPVWRTLSSALSLVISSGSSLGTANSVAFKLWVVLFDDGGTLRLGIINCLSRSYATAPTLNTVSVSPLPAYGLRSATSEGGAGGADSAQIIYTTSGVTITTKAFRVLGFMEWSSGLATAGTWASGPTTIQIYSPDVPLPGQTVQTSTRFAEAGSNTTSTSYVDITNSSVSITPTMVSNIVDVHYSYTAKQGVVVGANPIYYQQLLRGATVLNFTSTNYVRQEITSASGGIGFRGGISLRYIDYPQSTSATTYKLQHKVDNASSDSDTNAIGVVISEVMS